MAGGKRIKEGKRGEGSFRVTTSGSIEYRFSFTDPETGQRRRKSFTGQDEEECLEKAEQWSQIMEFERRGIDYEATIVDLLRESFLMDYEMNHVGEQGYARNIGTLKKFEKHSIGHIPICEIEREDIDDFLISITGHANSGIRKYYQLLKLAFKVAHEKEIISKNPMESHSMRCPKSDKPDKKVRGLTVEEQKKLVEQLEREKVPYGRNDYRTQLFIELYSGMRMGEINALKKTDIDLKNNVIHVRSTISRGIDYRPFIKKGTKTDNGQRDIPISDKLRPYLEKALNEKKKNPENLLFYDYNRGGVITTNQVNAYFKRVCERARITIRGQHALRHTFATRCIESGIPPVVLKNWLGHKDIHITLDTYTDVFKEMDHSAVEKLNEYINRM